MLILRWFSSLQWPGGDSVGNRKFSQNGRKRPISFRYWFYKCSKILTNQNQNFLIFCYKLNSIQFDGNICGFKSYPGHHSRTMILMRLMTAAEEHIKNVKLDVVLNYIVKRCCPIGPQIVRLQNFNVTSFVLVCDRIHDSHFVRLRSIWNASSNEAFPLQKWPLSIVTVYSSLFHFPLFNPPSLKCQRCQLSVLLLHLLSHGPVVLQLEEFPGNENGEE